jgi:peroxisomal 2,4-dienoyl-CoA reductase
MKRSPLLLILLAANRVLFITGGAGTIGSAQTRAFVHLGGDACIIGRNVEKTEAAAKEIAKVRQGARVIGIGGVDVRSVRIRSHLLQSGSSHY